MGKLKSLIEKQVNLGAIIPGSIKEQYTICGNANCICNDKTNPRKHGPYNKLSFSTKGKSSTMFIKSPDLKTATKMTASYKEKRILTQEIALEMISLCRAIGIDNAQLTYDDLYRQALRKYLGKKPESCKLREAAASKGKWKKTAVERKSKIEKLNIKVRDLSESRDRWKKEVKHQKEKSLGLSKELLDIKKNIRAGEYPLDR